MIEHFSTFFLLAAGTLALAPSDTTSLEDRFIEADGVRVHYTVQGDGEPVVLIHGFAGSIAMWAMGGMIADLSKDHLVIAIDVRGHGRSDKPHDSERYGTEMVTDVVRVLDDLGFEQAHVVGYSMGGMITLRLLTLHPDRVASAVIGGMGWWRVPENPEDDVLERVSRALLAGEGFGPLLEFLNPKGDGAMSAAAIEAASRMLLATNDPLALGALAHSFPRLVADEKQLRANAVPVLCLIGSDDPLGESVDAMRGVLAHARFEVLDGGDHMTTMVVPWFRVQVRTFLGAYSPAVEERELVPAGG